MEHPCLKCDKKKSCSRYYAITWTVKASECRLLQEYLGRLQTQQISIESRYQGLANKILGGFNEKSTQHIFTPGIKRRVVEYGRNSSAKRVISEKTNKPKRDIPINDEDIINLKIALGSSKSIDEFLVEV